MFLYAARLYRAGYQPNDATYAHDDWIQTLAEYGVIGFGLAVLAVAVLLGGGLKRFFAVVQYRASHGDRPLSNSAAILLGANATLVMFCVHGTIDFNMHIPANALLAGATLGLLASRESAAVPRPIETGIMRAFGFVATVALAAALSMFLWRHARADYENLRAANALAGGDVRTALARTEEGLKSASNDAGLLLTRGRAFYAYESSLALDSVSSDEAAGDENGEEKPVVELTPAEREKTYRSAAEVLAAAVAQRPMERRYRVELARALAELGRDKEARGQFVEGVRLDPDDGYAYSAYGDYFYDRDNLPAALSIYGMGRQTPNGDYSGTRYADMIEEMAPPQPDEETPPDAAEESSPDDEAEEPAEATP
jgi:tetratricopeptide (TPR) repeat protein